MDKKDFNYKLDKLIESAFYSGTIYGLKDALKSLNHFLVEKEKLGHLKYISESELNTFLDTYIAKCKAHFLSEGKITEDNIKEL